MIITFRPASAADGVTLRADGVTLGAEGVTLGAG
jgi:hypothetical protein